MTGYDCGRLDRLLERLDGGRSSGDVVMTVMCARGRYETKLQALRCPEEETEGSKKHHCVIVDGLVRLEEAGSCLVASVVDLSRIVVLTSCHRQGSMTSQSDGRWKELGEELRAQVAVGSRDRS